jgi:hypothetical protein
MVRVHVRLVQLDGNDVTEVADRTQRFEVVVAGDDRDRPPVPVRQPRNDDAIANRHGARFADKHAPRPTPHLVEVLGPLIILGRVAQTS